MTAFIEPLEHNDRIWIPSEAHDMIRACVTNTKMRVKVDGNLSEASITTTGLRQETFPNIVQPNVVKIVRLVTKIKEGVLLKGLHSSFGYTNDLLYERILKDSVDCVAYKRVGLILNSKKTKYMEVTCKNATRRVKQDFV